MVPYLGRVLYISFFGVLALFATSLLLYLYFLHVPCCCLLGLVRRALICCNSLPVFAPLVLGLWNICRLKKNRNNPLKTLILSSLCCKYDYKEAVVNLIWLTCRLKYVTWQSIWIKYKSTSSNVFLEISSLLLLCYFMSLNYVLYFFFLSI